MSTPGPQVNIDLLTLRKLTEDVETERARRHHWEQQERHWQAQRWAWIGTVIVSVVGLLVTLAIK